MEAIVKIEKTNTMTNAWRQTKTKTDKDRQRQEWQRIREGGPFALSINIPRLKTEIDIIFEFDNDY